MGTEALPLSSIKFHLTGFGRFYGMSGNPTEILMGRLTEFMKCRTLPFGATLESCTVLETAGIGALGSLLDLLDSASSSPYKGDELETLPEIPVEGMQGQGAQVIWIHFGVDDGASKFKVEQRAVNEATFGCPDEMGWDPEEVPIVAEDGPISTVKESRLPTASIVAELGKQGFEVSLSDDAGLFVCNYVYYHYLRHAENHATKCLLSTYHHFTSSRNTTS
jgi:pyroglutamyl-peptidase